MQVCCYKPQPGKGKETNRPKTQTYVIQFSLRIQSVIHIAILQVDELYKLRTQWLSIEPWRKWCFKVLDTITEHGLGVGGGFGSYDGADSLEGESPAIEVLKFREKNGYFGQSPDIRDPKNPAVIYRVGQVITQVM